LADGSCNQDRGFVNGVTVLVVRPANHVQPTAAKEFPNPVVLFDVEAPGMSHDDGVALAHVLGDPASAHFGEST
jgi:hypothetical protein